MIRDWTRYRRVCEGVDLLEAVLDRHVYERHMHDTFAIGLTLGGVQRFWCRGATHDSRPGNVIVIRPGEAHDGQSGTAHEYSYRMFYVSVAKLQLIAAHVSKDRACALGTSSAVVDDRKAFRALMTASNAALAGCSLAADQLVHDVLLSLAGDVADDDGAANRAALTRVRDYLHDRLARTITVDELATVAGISRFRLTRQFQRAYGLPLHAYHLHVRLEEARRRLTAGASIAAVAADLGFVDQSHLHRRFKGAFGMTPAEWQRCTTIQDTPRASS